MSHTRSHFDYHFFPRKIQNLGKKRNTWDPEVIKRCIIMQARAPGFYEYQRRRFTRLPCRNTLRTYLGKSTGEVGVTRSIRARLAMERKFLKDCEAHVSIQVDEMSLKAKRKLNKQWDKLVGAVDTGGILKRKRNGNRHLLANRLLAFVINGLSTSFKIPVAFFFVKQLTAEDLFQLTEHVLEEVEGLGFRVERIVGDNATTNAKMLKMWNDGDELVHEVVHPLDPKRKLFLSFDPTHVLKNVRNQLIDRDLDLNGDTMSFEIIRRLYEVQKDYPYLRPVRRLTRKHVEPSSIERQKVQWAVDIFSPETVAALEMFSDHGVHGFRDIGPTVAFLRKIGKWWALHDVSSTHQHVRKKDPNKKPYDSVDDERLKWLETFVEELEEWRENWSGAPDRFFTRETFEAITITTKATVGAVRYLLKELNFKFVLTRKFSTDDVERFFANVRAMGGGNNKVDVTSATCAVERITRTGIVESSIDHNVPLDKDTRAASLLIAETTIGPKKKQERTAELLKTVDPAFDEILHQLKREPGKQND